MSTTEAFKPQFLRGVGLSPSTTVAASSGAAASSTQLSGNQTENADVQIQITNLTNGCAFVNFGTYPNVAAATVAASYPVLPGSIVVTVAGTVSQASVILAAGATSGSVIFTRGTGF